MYSIVCVLSCDRKDPCSLCMRFLDAVLKITLRSSKHALKTPQNLRRLLTNWERLEDDLEIMLLISRLPNDELPETPKEGRHYYNVRETSFSWWPIKSFKAAAIEWFHTNLITLPYTYWYLLKISINCIKSLQTES